MIKASYAILLDGGFVTKKHFAANRRAATADDVVRVCDRLRRLPEVADYELLRIYYYDAYPSSQTVEQPITGVRHALAETPRFRQSQSLFDELELKSGFALRMGDTALAPDPWRLKPRVIRQLKSQPRPLVDKDFELAISQKGVDMRVGMDMARLALREMVRTIVVVTSDSDFVPAFKFVRREGVKVVLVTLGHKGVRRELRVHADVTVDTLD